MLTHANPFNVTDAGGLELDSAKGITTAVVGGTRYLFVSGQLDDGISVFSVAANGTLTNVFNVTDDLTLELDGADRLTTAVVGSTTYLFVCGFEDDGVQVFSVAAGGALTPVESETDAGLLTLDGAIGIATALSGGNRYLFISGYNDDGVSVFSVGATGALTNVATVTDAGLLELNGPVALATAYVGGTTYLFVAGFDDDGVSVFRVNTDGSLTSVFNVTDAGGLELDAPTGLTTAVVGGTTYLFVAGQDDDGVAVFSVAANGSLTSVFNVTDTATLELDGAFDVTTAVYGGQTYLYVTGSEDDGVSVFSVASNGALTNVANIPDTGALELDGAVGIASATVSNTAYVFAAGGFDDGVSVLNQDAPSAQLWMVVGGNSADTSANYVNNDGSNAAQVLPVHTEAQASIGIDLPAGYYFTVSTDKLWIESHRISDNAKVDEIQIGNPASGPATQDIVNNLVVDAYNETIYVGVWGQDEDHTGIVEVTYNPLTGDLNNNATYGSGSVYDGDTQYLITNTGTGGKVNDIRYMDLTTNGTASITDDFIYYSDVNNGSPFFNGPTNQIYRLDVDAGTVIQLSSNANSVGGFPVDYSRGYILSLAVNEADGLIYFLTHETTTNAGHLWRMPIAGGTATEIAAPAGHTFSFGDIPTPGLIFDPVTEQLYITVQSNIPQGFLVDEVIQVQMNAAGTAITGVVDFYLLSELVGHTPDPNAHAGGADFDQLPIFTKTDVGTAAVEQSTAVDIISAPTITDTDNDHLASATVAISGSFTGSGDLLFVLDGVTEKTSGTFTGIAGITIAVTTDGGGNKTLTLTGYDTLANYQTVLNAVGFRSTGDNPTNYGANDTRTLNWTVSDGAQNVPFGGQNTAITTLSITALNDNPLNNLPAGPSVNEDTQTAITGITITDVDADPANQDITVTFSVTNGTLNVLTSVLNGILASDITGGAQDTNTITITAPQNSINATIAASGLRYTGNLNYNGPDTLQIVTSDNGNTGTPGATGDTDNLSITVLPQNDTPDLTNVGPTATSIEQIFALLDSDAAVSDVDLDPLNSGNGLYTGASLTIVRNGGANASDDFDFGASGLFTVNGGNLQAGGLTFATFTDVAGTLTINFTSSGTAATSALVDDVIQHITYRFSTDDPPANITLNYTFNDGSPANPAGFPQGGGAQVATDTGSTTVTITAVNDEPTLSATGGTPTFTEGDASPADLYSAVTASTIEAIQTFASLTLTVTNVTDGANEILRINGVNVALTNGNSVVTGVGTAGVALSGSTATVTLTGATLSNAQLQTLVDGLAYSNTSQAPTDANRVVTITQVVDSGANGGPNNDDNTATLSIAATVNVDPVNDNPVATMTTDPYAATENVAVSIKNTGMSVSDIDAGSAVVTTTLSVTGGVLNVTAGTSGAVVGNSGTNSVTLTGTLVQINALLNTDATSTATYINNSDNPSSTVTLTLQINDGGATGAGGALTGSDTSTINITAVNDRPTIGVQSPGDVVFALLDANQVAVATGNGAGSFVSTSNGAGGGTNPFPVAIGDVNHDGNIDIVVGKGNSGTGSIVLLTGNGGGGFTATTVVASTPNPFNVELGDINRDGHLDIVTASGANALSIYFGDGAGAFTGGSTTVPGSAMEGLAIADVNRDGVVDIVTSNFGTDDLTIWINDGLGNLTPHSQSLGAGALDPRNVTPFDLDADGDIDLIVANQSSDNITVLTNDGAGNFTTSVLGLNGGTVPTWVAVGDVNGDTRLDLVTSNYGTDNITILLKNVGAGYTAQTPFSYGGTDPHGLVLADFNGDGDLDIFITNTASDDAKVLSNDGSGVFTATQTLNYTPNQTPVRPVYGAVATSVLTTNEDTNLVFSAANGNQITVADAENASLTVTLSVNNGAFTLGSTVGVGVAGNGTSSVTVTGTAAAINTALSSSFYQPTGNYNGSANLVITANDGSLSSTRIVSLSVTAVNDAPDAVLGTDPYVATEQTTLDLKNTGMSVSDLDVGGADVTVTLSVTEGTLSVTAGTSGVTNVTGSGSPSVTITGSIAAINALLNTDATSTVSYIDNTDAPSATATLSLQVNDGGNTGTGGAQSDTDTSTINITATNDAPNATITPTTYSGTPNNAVDLKNSGLSVSDVDGGPPGSETVTLSVSSGTLTVTTGTSGAGVAGSGTNSVTITGTIAQINALLNTDLTSTVSFVDTTGGSKTLTLAINDNGNTGGGNQTAQDTANINLGEPPVVDLNGGGGGTGATLAYAENDAATAIAPAGVTTDLDSPNYNGGSLTVHFSANGAAEDQLSILTDGTVTVSSGTVSVGGLAIGTVSGGANGADLVISFNTADATQAAVSTLIEHIGYANASDNPSTAARTASFTINDGTGATGSADATISITASNDGPAATITPPSYSATENVALSLKNNGLAVSDIDGSAGSETVTLSVGEGTLNVTAGGSGAVVTNSGTSSVTITGTLAQINALLNTDGTSTVSYTDGNDNPAASTTLTLAIDDNGNTGGGNLTANDTATINITPANDAPVATITPASYNATENITLNLKTNGLSVSDVDGNSGSMTVTLSVTEGTLNVQAGGTGAIVSGSPSGSVTITGTVAQINALLQTDGTSVVQYTDNNDNSGTTATLTLAIDDNGNTGGGNLTSQDTATINITQVNDAPVAAITPTSYSATEQTALNLKNNGLSVTDVDGGGGSETVTLSVGQGVLNVSAGGSGAIVTNSGTASVTITGSAAQINALLNTDGTSSVSYLNGSDTPSASTTLTLLVHDNGNTGTGGDLSSSDAATINITAVNDVPALTGLTDTPAFTENGSSVLLDANGNAAVSDPELDVSGNYAGAMLTLQRQGGPNLDDSFAATGTLDLVDVNGFGENVSLDGGATFIGTFVDNGDGSISFTFNANATAADINSVMRQIGYGNASDNPPTTVPIDFIFNDGNGLPSGQAQGTGAGVTTATVNVQVTQVDDAPALLNVAPGAAYAIGSAGVVLSSALGVFDIDATPPSALIGIANATIKIETGFFAGDQLFVNLPTSGGFFIVDDGGGPVVTNISVASNALGQLVLSGQDTTLHYQFVLDAVNYRSIAVDPSNGGLNPTRTISWVVNDGALNSQTPNLDENNLVNATILHFDAPPALDLDASGAGTGFTISFTENGAAVAIVDTDLSITDPDNTTLDKATIVLTNAKAGDVLSVVGALPAGIDSSIDTSVPGQITVTFVNAATIADYVTALGQVRFSNSSENPDTTDRDITVQVGVTEATSNTAHTTVTVVAVNDAPVLGGVPATAGYRPHGAPVVIAAALALSDLDNTTLASATVHISAGTFAGDGDVLAVSAGGLAGTAISASYNAATETLTLTGVDTLAHYEQVLEHVTFESTSINPTNAGLNKTRTVEWQVNDGSGANNLSAVTTTTINIVNPPLFDFNGDGLGDILWQNSDGTPAVWLMNGTSVAAFGPPLPNPSETRAGITWKEIDAGDFNGDGKADILWQANDGTPAVWLMNGTEVALMGPGLSNPGPTWHVKEAADFDGDGKADILWQNDNGAAAVWLMDGVNVVSTSPPLPNPGPAWHVMDAADFDGDGKADILWQNDNGTPAVWLMDGVNVLSTGPALANPGPAWHEIAAADFNGDGMADILWQNDNGTPAVWLMDGTGILSEGPALANPGAAWHAKEAADTNGDGMADIVWQHDNGTPAVWLMNGTAVASFGPGLPDPGTSWHII